MEAELQCPSMINFLWLCLLSLAIGLLRETIPAHFWLNLWPLDSNFTHGWTGKCQLLPLSFVHKPLFSPVWNWVSWQNGIRYSRYFEHSQISVLYQCKILFRSDILWNLWETLIIGSLVLWPDTRFALQNSQNSNWTPDYRSHVLWRKWLFSRVDSMALVFTEFPPFPSTNPHPPWLYSPILMNFPTWSWKP